MSKLNKNIAIFVMGAIGGWAGACMSGWIGAVIVGGIVTVWAYYAVVG